MSIFSYSFSLNGTCEETRAPDDDEEDEEFEVAPSMLLVAGPV